MINKVHRRLFSKESQEFELLAKIKQMLEKEKSKQSQEKSYYKERAKIEKKITETKFHTAPVVESLKFMVPSKLDNSAS